MPELLSFFIILVAGLVLSGAFKRLHLPYVTALIFAGILIGPFAMNLIELNDTLLFLGGIGVVFLMFIAGTEIKTDFLRETRKDVFVISILNGLLPFFTGFIISLFLGFSFFTSLILGIVFVSSSIAVIIPSLESTGLIKKRLGKDIIASTVVEDVGSLILLAVILQTVNKTAILPIYLYIPAVLFLIVALKFVVPKLQKIYTQNKKGKDLFENELRFIFAVLIATVLLFELIGMHSIVAGFIIGIIVGDSVRGRVGEKIRTLSYGLFIPVFFLILGIQTDISNLFSSKIIITLIIIAGLFASKIVSGWIAGRILKFTNRQSLLIGIATTPQLSTTLAAAFAALEFGLLNTDLITSLVILSIVTTLVSPILIKTLSSKIASN